MTEWRGILCGVMVSLSHGDCRGISVCVYVLGMFWGLSVHEASVCLCIAGR